LIDDRQLEEDLVELDLQINRLAAQRSRRLSEVDRRRSYEDHGYLSTTAWLRDRCRITGREAARRIHRARALTGMAATASAYRDGDLAVQVVDLLALARKAHPATFAEHETGLVEQLRTLSPRDGSRLIAYWRQALDHPNEDAAVQHRRRRLSIASTFGGMVHGEFELDPESGEAVIAALRALSETTDDSDDRSPTQRRADALVELCRDYLDHGDTPIRGGEKPHVSLLVSLETLEGRAGYTCELDECGVVPPEVARRLACDSGVSRIITKGASEPLDVGRRTRTIPSAIRRALVLRDGGCVISGCDRPSRWCDAHHIMHWVDGGPTSLDNLELLCRRHHRMTHEGKDLARRPRAP
ncbi:MAG: DUF222 domain-containing protein, partial [Acidimicrobiia bacterium]